MRRSHWRGLVHAKHGKRDNAWGVGAVPHAVNRNRAVLAGKGAAPHFYADVGAVLYIGRGGDMRSRAAVNGHAGDIGSGRGVARKNTRPGVYVGTCADGVIACVRGARRRLACRVCIIADSGPHIARK